MVSALIRVHEDACASESLGVAPDLLQTLLVDHRPLTRPFGPPSPRFAGRGSSFVRSPISANASKDPSAIAPAATAAALHPSRRSAVGTSGFGGRLYARGSPRTMKNA